jgi:hypothetical protein
MVFQHKFIEATDVEFTCQLSGCNRKYMLKVIPKLFIYPKYCEEHRSEFKRAFFLLSA